MNRAFQALAKRIETVCLVLRPFELEDVDDVLAYAADPEWTRFLAYMPQPFERADAEQFIARRILRDWNTNPTWAIELDGRALGGINLQIESDHRRATTSYGVARSHWGRGLTAEAARAVIDTAFETWPELNRIQSFADARNTACCA